MEFKKSANKIYLENESGNEVARVEFLSYNINEITITHTFVDKSLQGQGIAKKLLDEVCLYAEENKLTIIPECSYAVNYFEKLALKKNN